MCSILVFPYNYNYNYTYLYLYLFVFVHSRLVLSRRPARVLHCGEGLGADALLRAWSSRWTVRRFICLGSWIYNERSCCSGRGNDIPKDITSEAPSEPVRRTRLPSLEHALRSGFPRRDPLDTDRTNPSHRQKRRKRKKKRYIQEAAPATAAPRSCRLHSARRRRTNTPPPTSRPQPRPRTRPGPLRATSQPRPSRPRRRRL